jgi:hypothetical protein
LQLRLRWKNSFGNRRHEGRIRTEAFRQSISPKEGFCTPGHPCPGLPRRPSNGTFPRAMTVLRDGDTTLESIDSAGKLIYPTVLPVGTQVPSSPEETPLPLTQPVRWTINANSIQEPDERRRILDRWVRSHL